MFERGRYFTIICIHPGSLSGSNSRGPGGLGLAVYEGLLYYEARGIGYYNWINKENDIKKAKTGGHLIHGKTGARKEGYDQSCHSTR